MNNIILFPNKRAPARKICQEVQALDFWIDEIIDEMLMESDRSFVQRVLDQIRRDSPILQRLYILRPGGDTP